MELDMHSSSPSTAGASLRGARSTDDAEPLRLLETVTEVARLDSLTQRLFEMRRWLDGEITEVEAALSTAAHTPAPTAAEKIAQHLLRQAGKRIRPICVVLAARTFSGWNAATRSYAIAVELVHAATLLHDDVVDVGDERRGAPTARVLLGNAASIFGGDFLLVEALRLVQSTGQADVLARLLEVIREMVLAESRQLAFRGRIDATEADYLDVIDGKTASLFRWAMFAGARAGGASTEEARALEDFGARMGRAFQLVDDVLDYAGDPADTGKSLLADLREGKLTLPLLYVRDRDPAARALLTELFEASREGGDGLDAKALGDIGERVVALLRARGALDDTTRLARQLCDEAAAALAHLPDSDAKRSLVDVARAAPNRRK